MMDSTRQVIASDTTKRVTQITVILTMNDCTGTLNVTDLMLQGGKISTDWTGHPSEIKWDNEG